MGNTVKDKVITQAEIFNCPSVQRKGFIYGTANNPLDGQYKANLTSFNFSTNIQRFSPATGKLFPGEKKFYVSMLENQALSMDAYWFKTWFNNSHEDFSNAAYSDGHVKTVKHSSVPNLLKITGWSTSFNSKVQQMWTDFEDHF